MKHIYLSFSRQDFAAARPLMQALQRDGHRVRALRTGAGPEHAQRLLRHADVCIVLLSASSQRSQRVRFEETYARANGLQVIRILISPDAAVQSGSSVLDAVGDPDSSWDTLRRMLNTPSGYSQQKSPKRTGRFALLGVLLMLFAGSLVAFAALQESENTKTASIPTLASTLSVNRLPALGAVEATTTETPQFSVMVEPSSGPAPLTVAFIVQNGNAGEEYNWDFEADGQLDVLSSDFAGYIYQNPGNYTANLHISGTKQDIISFTIEVWDPTDTPISDQAALAATEPATSPEATESINTTPNESEAITSTPSITPVTGEGPVTAAFDISKRVGDAPLSIRVRDMSTGAVLRRSWDFNSDGITDSTDMIAEHTYQQLGRHEITLTVFDTDNQAFEITDFVLVLEPEESSTDDGGEILADFLLNPAFGESPLSVSFENYSVGPIAKYEWDFNGDGRVDSTTANPPPFTYPAAGVFPVTLKVYDINGGVSTFEDIVDVFNPGELNPPDKDKDNSSLPPALLADFIINPPSGSAPLTVSIENLSDGPVQAYNWNFGNGQTSTAANPIPVIYNTPGSYTISLTVTSASGQSDTYNLTVEVYESSDEISGDVPEAGFTPPLAIIRPGQTVTFINTTESEVSSYQWDFGNGQTSTAANPAPVTYSTPGSYIVTLIVSGPGGTSEPTFGRVVVQAPPATATATATPTPTITSTPTLTQTTTPSVTPSQSPTATPTATSTAIVTPNATATNTLTPTTTSTVTPAATASASATPATTSTWTSTPTLTMTLTSSPTWTTTYTATSTATPIPSASATFTMTPSVTPTLTLTSSPSPTATPTVTPSATPSLTPSYTSTTNQKS